MPLGPFKLIYVNIPGETGLENRSQKQLPQFKPPRIIILSSFAFSPGQERVPDQLSTNITGAALDPVSAPAHDGDVRVCLQ